MTEVDSSLEMENVIKKDTIPYVPVLIVMVCRFKDFKKALKIIL